MVKFFENKTLTTFTKEMPIKIRLYLNDKPTILFKKKKLIFLINIKITKLNLIKIFYHILGCSLNKINISRVKSKKKILLQKIIVTMKKKTNLNLYKIINYFKTEYGTTTI